MKIHMINLILNCVFWKNSWIRVISEDIFIEEIDIQNKKNKGFYSKNMSNCFKHFRY